MLSGAERTKAGSEAASAQQTSNAFGVDGSGRMTHKSPHAVLSGAERMKAGSEVASAQQTSNAFREHKVRSGELAALRAYRPSRKPREVIAAVRTIVAARVLAPTPPPRD